MKDNLSKTPEPEFTEPTFTVDGVVMLRSSRRHPVTGRLCYTTEEWEAEETKVKGTVQKPLGRG